VKQHFLSVESDASDEIVKSVVSDGYVQLPRFYNRDRIRAVRKDLLDVLNRDARARRQGVRQVNRFDQGLFRTVLTPEMHTRFFPSFEVQSFAKLVGDLMRDPRLKALRRYVLGPGFQLRTDLIRRSSGLDDSVDEVQIPHEWHRDGVGEFTFGVFFDDLTRTGSGGTMVVPGSHLEEVDPRWDMMISETARPQYSEFLAGQRRIDPALLLDAKANRAARKEIGNRAQEIIGRMGDIYFFFNQTWHGRAANVSGKRFAIARVGGCVAGFPSPSIKHPETVLPDETLRALYAANNPAPQTEPYIVKMTHKRSSSPAFALAKLEKARLCDRV